MTPAKTGLFAIMAGLLAACAPNPPALQTANKTIWLQQNWNEEQREWFYFTSQGTATLPLPYEWFIALERPELSVFGEPGLLSSGEYLPRFGFIADKKSKANPAGLPVGFAVDYDYKDPVSGQAFHSIGFTCAACHTGQINYKGTKVIVDGGPAVTDVPSLVASLGYAMAYTKFVPFRFDRFAKRVLGANYSDENKAKLWNEFEQVWNEFQRLAKLDKGVAKDSVKEGFARLDALSRIGNQVFAINFKESNYHATDAPVSYPHIWSRAWYDWVQYDASIMQPMVRNAGESLGVAAGINLAGPKETRFNSTAKVKELYELEELLAGSKPPTDNHQFNGLYSPKWPEQVFGAIDTKRADAGKKLYVEYCQSCHLPPVDSEEFWSDQHWSPANEAGQRYLHPLNSAISEIGTDPMQAKALADRTVDTQGMGLNTTVYVPGKMGCEPAPVKDGSAVPYGAALGAVVQETVKYWYDKHNIPEADRNRMNGYRPNCLDAGMQYAARPLNGIWATPPYLHNGSVPNLYALLSPVSERPATFYLGNQEFDPQAVGYQTGKFEGGFNLDTQLKGNSNRGHEFDDGPKGKGIIGPRLTPEQRSALVEYLKTL